MSLIEQLGGYEKAKGYLNTPTARECVKNELCVALLEYRRQHNIFEVGDKVVFNSYNLPADLATIKDFHKDCVGAVYRHATGAEIKEGKRL